MGVNDRHQSSKSALKKEKNLMFAESAATYYIYVKKAGNVIHKFCRRPVPRPLGSWPSLLR